MLPLATFGLLAAILFALNSNVVSAHRYTLPVVTVYVALAIFSTQHPTAFKVVYLATHCCQLTGAAIPLLEVHPWYFCRMKHQNSLPLLEPIYLTHCSVLFDKL